ncbi:MAG TPA: histidinol-phosphate transaminase [Oculatellaceae cyanobacterium]
MATHIQQLAAMNDPRQLSLVPSGTPPKKLVPPHIEALTPYQPGRPPEDLKKELGLDRIVNLASNENPLGPPASAVAAIENCLTEISRYPDMGGLKLRKALAARHDVSIANVAIGSGSESIMANIVRAFLHGDDEVLTSQGTFIGLYVLVRAQGVKLNMVPLKDYKFDLDAIADAVNPRTKIIYLCNPNNPTGTIFTRTEFESFIKKIPEHVLVILDEAYYEFTAGNPDFPDSMSYRLDNVLTLRTFAKAYAMAGLRLGYGLGHEYLIDFVNRIKLPFEPNILAQAAGHAALNEPDFLERTIANNDVGMAYITAEFNKLGLHYVSSSGNFVMVEMGRQDRVTHIHESLLRKGIAIRPLAAFGLPTCFRVTIGLPHDNSMFIRGLKDALASLPV